MDPMSSYFLDIRLIGNRKKMRKEFNCFRFDKVIDSDITNFKDFIESIVDQYPPGYLEVPHVQYRDCVESIFPEVKTDQDLQLMFDKHKQTKVAVKNYGHHWPSCKKGNPEDIAAFMAERYSTMHCFLLFYC
jgi:hypothetical protein